jgi:hypothetical protein
MKTELVLVKTQVVPNSLPHKYGVPTLAGTPYLCGSGATSEEICPARQRLSRNTLILTIGVTAPKFRPLWMGS